MVGLGVAAEALFAELNSDGEALAWEMRGVLPGTFRQNGSRASARYD
jgi:hypothetical protein